MGATTYEQILTFGDWPYGGKRSYGLTRRSLSTDRSDIQFVANLPTLLADIER